MPSGVGAGGPFVLRPWQRDFIADVYRTGDDGRLITRRAVLSMGRKNGKTALIAALALAHLIGPEAIMNGEIYSAATERHQAAQVFKVAAQMITADEELGDHLKVVESSKTIACHGNGSVYRALSAATGSKHGLNPSVVIYDELAQAKDRGLYDVLDTAQAAREEPLFITISTQSNDPQHILSEIIDDGLRYDDPSTVVHLYAADEDADPWSDEAWYAANPALGDFRSYEELKIQAERARRMPSFAATFKNLYLNMRVNPNTPLIPVEEWNALATDKTLASASDGLYLGMDLSATTDLTSLVAVTDGPDLDIVDTWNWKPEDLIAEHENRDRAPYGRWAAEGLLEVSPGRTIEYGQVARKLIELSQEFKIRGVAFDRWRIDVFLKAALDIGLECYVEGRDTPTEGAVRLVPWSQNFRDMAPAVDALETLVLSGRLRHRNNPVLNMCLGNAIAAVDAAGNRRLDKSKTRLRIDAAQALVMALGLKAREVEPAVALEPGIMVI